MSCHTKLFLMFGLILMYRFSPLSKTSTLLLHQTLDWNIFTMLFLFHCEQTRTDLAHKVLIFKFSISNWTETIYCKTFVDPSKHNYKKSYLLFEILHYPSCSTWNYININTRKNTNWSYVCCMLYCYIACWCDLPKNKLVLETFLLSQ